VLDAKTLAVGESLMAFYRAQHHKPGWIEKTMREHREIFGAIEARNGPLASELLHKHVHFDSEQFADLASQFD
jgi:DNA-binding GntR family transcriptional regulator